MEIFDASIMQNVRRFIISDKFITFSAPEGFKFFQDILNSFLSSYLNLNQTSWWRLVILEGTISTTLTSHLIMHILSLSCVDLKTNWFLMPPNPPLKCLKYFACRVRRSLKHQWWNTADSITFSTIPMALKKLILAFKINLQTNDFICFLSY